MFERAERHSTRWIAWMPLLFVSAFLYWSVALGLGGLSLMAAGTLSGGCPMSRQAFSATAVEPFPGTLSGEAIMVHLQESADLDQDQAGPTPSSRWSSTCRTTTAPAGFPATTEPSADGARQLNHS